MANPFRKDGLALARKALEDARRGLSNADARRETAAAEVTEAERTQSVAAMSDGDAAPGVLEAATRRLRDARDLLTAFDDRVLPAARDAVDRAEAGVTNAERETVYAAAVAKRKAAADRLAREYPDIFKRYQELTELVRDADAAISTANSQLPEGRDPLGSTETLVRDIPEEDGRVISDKIEDVWFFGDGSRCERPELVRSTGGGQGHYDPPQRANSIQPRQSIPVFSRPNRVVVALPRRSPVFGARLAKSPMEPLRPEPPAAAQPTVLYRQPDDERVVA